MKDMRIANATLKFHYCFLTKQAYEQNQRDEVRYSPVAPRMTFCTESIGLKLTQI